MKKSILILAAAFTFSSFFTSCRETADEETEVEVINTEEELETRENDLEVEEDLEEDGDIENAIEEGVNEVGENTGIDGTDDV